MAVKHLFFMNKNLYNDHLKHRNSTLHGVVFLGVLESGSPDKA